MIAIGFLVFYLTGMIVCGAITSNRDTLISGDLDMVPHLMLSFIWPFVLPAIGVIRAMKTVGFYLKNRCSW